jgi:hypothetical protein
MEKNAGLCAAEAFVLLSLPRYDVRQALKLGFMGLLAQGVLQIEQEDRPGLIRTRHIAHLRVAANLSEALPPITGSLVRITSAAAPNTGARSPALYRTLSGRRSSRAGSPKCASRGCSASFR